MQFPPYTVLTDPYMEQQLMAKKKKSSKGLLTCWLILPFLLFILGLIFFIILISTHHSSSVSVDHAISVTEQLGQDVQALPWKNIITSSSACTSTNSFPIIEGGVSYAEFQGIQSGYINQLQVNKEYAEVEDKESCTGSTCKEEKGIAAKSLTKAVSTSNRLCVKKIDFDKFIAKDRAADCPNSLQFCAESKVCVTSNTADCPLTSLNLESAGSAAAFPKASNKLSGVTSGTHRNFVIGLRGGFTVPCKNPDFLGERPSKTDYPLLGIQYTGCDEYGTYDNDQAPVRVSGLKYKDLLENNDIKNTVHESPYFYEYIAAQDSTVYNVYEIHRPKIVEDSRCNIGNKGFSQLQHVRRYLGTANRPLFVYVVIGLTFSSIGLFFWIILIIVSHSNKKSKMHSQLYKIVHLIAIILAILIIIMFIHYMSALSGKKDGLTTVESQFNTAASIGCYSNAAGWNNAFDKVNDFVRVALKYAYPLVITLFCIGVVYLVLMLIVFAIIKAKHASAFKPPYSHQ